MPKFLEKWTQGPMWPVSATYEVARTTLQVSANPSAYQGVATKLPGTGNPTLYTELPTSGDRSVATIVNTKGQIAVDTTNKGWLLQKGVWQFHMEFLVENPTTASLLGIHLTDEVSSASTARYFLHNTHFIGALGAGVTQAINLDTNILIETPGTVCLRALSATASGTIILTSRVRITKVANYPEP